MITLYEQMLSVDCYKVKLFLSLIAQPFQCVPVDAVTSVIDDEGYALQCAHASLVYLAVRYDFHRTWFPNHAHRLGEQMSWLSFAAYLDGTLSAGREQLAALERGGPRDACRRDIERRLRALDEHLWFAEAAGNGGWIGSDPCPTVADVACFPSVALSYEGGVDLEDYPAVRRWTDRLRSRDRFTVMPGIFALR